MTLMTNSPLANPANARPTAKISVIVPVYNVEHWLDDCLASIRAQSLSEIEIILVDDGSTDSSSEISRRAAGADNRIVYIRQENGGLGPARNTGIAAATADYLTFVDSDDTIHQDYCKKLYDAAIAGKSDIVSCMFHRTDEIGTLTTPQDNFIAKPVELKSGEQLEDFEKILGLYSSSMAQCRLYRRKLIETAGLTFPDRIPHEDWFFTWKAFMHAKRVTHVEEPLYFWRIREGSLSNSAGPHHIETPLLLIDDTYDTLEAAQASERARSIADRRTLQSLAQIYDRIRRLSPQLTPRMLERTIPHLDKITSIYMRADRDVVEKYHLQGASRLIEDAAAKRAEGFFARRSGFLQTLNNFRHARSDRDKLLTLRNAFAGERCFIIGNGPSLNEHDLELIKDEYTFAVNSFFLKTRDTGFFPTFYTVEDSKVMEENVDDIRNYPAAFKFFPEDYQKYGLASESTCFFKMDWDFYFKSKPYHGIPRFSTVAHERIYAGQTVTVANLQLAYYLGFTEAYLIGMDFSYFIPPEHKINGNHILSTTDDPNHFHKDYFGKGKTWKDPKLDRVAVSYRQVKLSFEAAGRKVFNATIGGKLEIFDRVDYEGLLRDPVTGNKRVLRVPPMISALGRDDNARPDSLDRQTRIEADTRSLLLRLAREL